MGVYLTHIWRYRYATHIWRYSYLTLTHIWKYRYLTHIWRYSYSTYLTHMWRYRDSTYLTHMRASTSELSLLAWFKYASCQTCGSPAFFVMCMEVDALSKCICEAEVQQSCNRAATEMQQR
jgi:hypothetical protein